MRIRKLRNCVSIKFSGLKTSTKEANFKKFLVGTVIANQLKVKWTTMNHVYIYPNGCEYWDDVVEAIIKESKADLNQSFEF